MRKTMTPVREAFLYFGLTLGASYLFWVPIAALGVPAGNFVSSGGKAGWGLVPLMLGGFVPSTMALLLTGMRAGKQGMRDLWRRLTRFRIGWRWYVAALVAVVVPAAGQIAILRLLGASFDFSLFVKQLPSAIPLVFIGPLSEELGWRGYALDRLQTRFGATVSALVVGVVWAVWHLPLFFMVGTSQRELAIPFLGFLCGVTALSVLFTWLHNNTGGALWTAVFFHWIYTYAGQVVATGATRSAAYNWLEYAPFVATALVVLLLKGLGRPARGAAAG